jgi:hypothetical protein
LETHDVKPDLYRTYIKPFQPYFPHHCFVALTDQGNGQGRRAVVALAKNASSLYGNAGILKSTVDVQTSRLDFISKTLENREPPSGDPVAAIADFAKAPAGHDSAKRVDLNEKEYWRSMAKGYLHYRDRRSVTNDNPYIPTFKALYDAHKADPELSKHLKTDDDVRQRVTRRFNDIDRLAGIDAQHQVDPIRVIDCSFLSGRKIAIKHGEFDYFTHCDVIDGYHRLFWARFLGVKKLDAIYSVGDSIAS